MASLGLSQQFRAPSGTEGADAIRAASQTGNAFGQNLINLRNVKNSEANTQIRRDELERARTRDIVNDSFRERELGLSERRAKAYEDYTVAQKERLRDEYNLRVDEIDRRNKDNSVLGKLLREFADTPPGERGDRSEWLSRLNTQAARNEFSQIYDRMTGDDNRDRVVNLGQKTQDEVTTLVEGMPAGQRAMFNAAANPNRPGEITPKQAEILNNYEASQAKLAIDRQDEVKRQFVNLLSGGMSEEEASRAMGIMYPEEWAQYSGGFDQAFGVGSDGSPADAVFDVENDTFFRFPDINAK